jgi:NADH:ubiquinone oxidoreductase subunit K
VLTADEILTYSGNSLDPLRRLTYTSPMEAFTPLGFLLRLLAAIVLVLCTFNPSGYSYYHWVATVFPHVTPVQAIVGIALLVGWIVYLTATMRSIGFIGVAIALAFFAAVIWLIASWGWLDPHNATAMTWVVLVVCAAILAVGMSWSHIRRRLTGQADVDEVEQK